MSSNLTQITVKGRIWFTFDHFIIGGAIKHKTLVVIGVDCIGEDTNPTTILSQP
jgi:hypothetical protein